MYEKLTGIRLKTADKRKDKPAYEPPEAFDISDKMCEVINKTLEIIPNNRYKNADELIKALYTEKENCLKQPDPITAAGT